MPSCKDLIKKLSKLITRAPRRVRLIAGNDLLIRNSRNSLLQPDDIVVGWRPALTTSKVTLKI